MPIASFNVENLFSRARVMNLAGMELAPIQVSFPIAPREARVEYKLSVAANRAARYGGCFRSAHFRDRAGVAPCFAVAELGSLRE